jgi:hypothetical protein
LKARIPATAIVLTGPWDGTAPPATRHNVSEALRTLEPSHAAFFACHCARAPIGRSSQSNLLLTTQPDSTADATLAAQDLLTDSTADPKFPLPSEVVLSTCDSAGAAAASGGEWLSVGPAALWAGASAVVVSLFPVFDNDQLDAHLIRQAADPQRTNTLASALLDYQRRALVAWRKGDRDATPLWWAGYAPLGHPYLSCERETEPHPPIANTSALSQPKVTLSVEAVRLIEEAGSIYEMIRPKVVTTLDLAAEWMSENDEDAWNGTFAATMQNLFAADLLAIELLRDAALGPFRAREARRPHPTASTLSENLVKIIDDTGANVWARGRSVIQPEDLILALLKASTPARGFFRALRYGRRAQVVNGLRISGDWCSPYRWIPLRKVMFGKPERLGSIDALGLTPPEPEPQTREPDGRGVASSRFSTRRWT